MNRRKTEQYEKLYSAFDTIINNVQNRIDYYDKGMYAYYRECRTVHINPGRQSGKTTYIAKKFDPHHDIIICYNIEMRQHFISLLLGEKAGNYKGRFFCTANEKCIKLSLSDLSKRIFTTQEIEQGKFDNMTRGQHNYSLRKIWIDEPRFSIKNNFNFLYNIIETYLTIRELSSEDLLFIKMGE